MKDSKRTIITIALFLLFLAVYSFLVIRPYENSSYDTENDRELRNDLAGTLDTIIAGASHGQYGISPVMMDEALGTSTFNLSAPWQTSYGTRLLMEKELERNPIKKVYLIISEGTFAQERTTDGITGDVKMLPRLDDIPERADYLIHSAAPEEIPDIYQDMVNRGFTYLKALVSGEETDNVHEENRGYNPKKRNSVALDPETAASKKSKRKVSTKVVPENEENLTAIIEMCKERGVEVQVVIVPISDKAIWTWYGWDKWFKIVKNFCAKHEIGLWDFNLYRGRFELFNDKNCYRNDTHLSQGGAEIFTNLLIETIRRDAAGEDISPDFYPNYTEMKKDSPYNPEQKTRGPAAGAWKLMRGQLF